MNVLVTTIGSSGDVNPFLAVALALKRRGHEPTMVVNPHFVPLVESLGLACRPCGEPFDLRRIAEHPDMMHPTKGPKVIWRDFVLPNAEPMLDAVEAAIGELSPDVVVGHPICCSPRWASVRHGIPFVSVLLSPMVWFSRYETTILAPWEPDDPPKAWLRLRDFVARQLMRRWIDAPLNQLRRQRGLMPAKNQLAGSFRKGDLILAMWSERFRRAMPDDPPKSHICGFPWFDGAHWCEELTPAVSRFLAEGEPPIVFTLGSTAVHVAGKFYHHAAEACRLIGRRGLMLTGDTASVPKDLPPEILAVDGAPHSLVMPRGCATVVHGGIGTTAQALRAGKPFVVVPFAHDQFDNAARTKRLGVSATVKRHKLTPATLAEALRTVLDDPECVDRAKQLGAALREEDGAETAAEAICDAFDETEETSKRQNVEMPQA